MIGGIAHGREDQHRPAVKLGLYNFGHMAEPLGVGYRTPPEFHHNHTFLRYQKTGVYAIINDEMTVENALAAYKNKPALVKEKAGDKILIVLSGGESIKVREKDIELVHPGPLRDLGGIEDAPAPAGEAIREAWELLLADGGAVMLKELAELAFGEYSPASAWAAFALLLDGRYFSGGLNALRPRSREAVEADEKKRAEKQRETGERERFLERLRRRRPDPEDGRFLQDVEALARGKSSRSRTMKDLGLGETPEDAHALLLDAGCWTVWINPHPSRFGLSPASAKSPIEPPPAEARRDLTRLAAFAIDSPWSNDPDDAVSVEAGALYVHVADPAAAITPDSAAEQEARDRGATLYLPEGSARMLPDEALPLFALGLGETSPALTFKLSLDENGRIAETEIFPSTVQVRRLTYEAADRLLEDGGADGSGAAELREIRALAERNLRRRTVAGAVNIDLPETHISLEGEQVRIAAVAPRRSADMVKECMLLAGEGAGRWAALRSLPFPYVCQEAGDIPNEVLPGMAGSYQLRRCMRPRTLSLTPGRHWGLGLDCYTQITSPLRRYTDLLAHFQIRAVLSGREPLSAEEAAIRLGAGEAAAAAAVQAERASRAHWTAVYLAGKKDSVWAAAAMEKKGNRWTLMIPALAMEAKVPLRKDVAPNEPVSLILKSVNIPRAEANFTAAGD
jgi:exoribonuclease-2